MLRPHALSLATTPGRSPLDTASRTAVRSFAGGYPPCVRRCCFKCSSASTPRRAAGALVSLSVLPGRRRACC